MFGFGKKRFDAEEDQISGEFMATKFTNLPLNDFMTRLMAEELPFLDADERKEVLDILEKYRQSGEPEITSQDELPTRIRDLMDLY